MFTSIHKIFISQYEEYTFTTTKHMYKTRRIRLGNTWKWMVMVWYYLDLITTYFFSNGKIKLRKKLLLVSSETLEKWMTVNFIPTQYWRHVSKVFVTNSHQHNRNKIAEIKRETLFSSAVIRFEVSFTSVYRSS